MQLERSLWILVEIIRLSWVFCGAVTMEFAHKLDESVDSNVSIQNFQSKAWTLNRFKTNSQQKLKPFLIAN